MPVASPDSVLIAIGNGGTGQVTAQAAIDALTQVACATNEHVLTKDTCTGNAVWKAASGGISCVVCDTTPTLGGQLDANANNIINVGYSESNATNPASTGAIRLGNTENISWRNAANTNNVTLGVNASNELDIFHCGVNTFEFKSNELCVNGLDIRGASNIFFNDGCDMEIQNSSGNMQLRAGDTHGIEMRINAGALEYSFNQTTADFNGNNLINVGYFESNATNPGSTGAIRLGSTDTIVWRCASNTSDITLSYTNPVGNSIQLSNAQFELSAGKGIIWAQSTSRQIVSNNSGMEIRDDGMRIDLMHNTTVEYRFNQTQADFNGNNIINVGYFESNATNPSTAGVIRIGSTESIGWRNNANSADVLLAKNTCDKLTFDGHIADPVGVHDMPVPASAMWAGTTEGATGLTATEFGAAGHKITLQTFDFTSTTADERVQFRTPLPREYDNGTVDIQINWSFASGTGDVRWGARMVATGDNEAIATNFGTAVEANDTAGTADQIQQVTLSTITIGNTPADTNEIHFEIYREGSDAGDTFSGTARLHSVVVRFTTDSAVSA